MIKVNLLATGPTGATPARVWVPREQRSSLLGLSFIVITGLAVSGWWYYLGTVRTKIDARISAGEAQMVRLKEASKLVEKTLARKTELTERLAVIERLRASKRAPVNLLETLSRSLADGLWLTEVKQTAGTVQMDGRAMSLTAVTDFAERLQNSGLFQMPVEILTTSNDTVEETTVVKFSMKGDLVAQNPVTQPQTPTKPQPAAPAPASPAPRPAGA